MSDQTKAALDAAVAAHVADECAGALTTGWALICAAATDQDFANGQTEYFVEQADMQPHHSTLGLVSQHKLMVENVGWELATEEDD